MAGALSSRSHRWSHLLVTIIMSHQCLHEEPHYHLLHSEDILNKHPASFAEYYNDHLWWTRQRFILWGSHSFKKQSHASVQSLLLALWWQQGHVRTSPRQKLPNGHMKRARSPAWQQPAVCPEKGHKGSRPLIIPWSFHLIGVMHRAIRGVQFRSLFHTAWKHP